MQFFYKIIKITHKTISNAHSSSHSECVIKNQFLALKRNLAENSEKRSQSFNWKWTLKKIHNRSLPNENLFFFRKGTKFELKCKSKRNFFCPRCDSNQMVIVRERICLLSSNTEPKATSPKATPPSCNHQDKKRLFCFALKNLITSKGHSLKGSQ